MSQFFASGGQSIGLSASASDLPMNIQDWYPLGLTGLISLQSRGLLRVFFSIHMFVFFILCVYLWMYQSNLLLETHIVFPSFIILVFLIFIFFFITGGKLLYNFVLVSVIKQHKSAIIIHVSPPSWTSLLILDHTPPGLHRAPGCAPCFLPAIFVAHGSVYMSMVLSPFLSVSPSPNVSTSPFSTSESPLFPCKKVHQYHFSRFHIYVY